MKSITVEVADNCPMPDDLQDFGAYYAERLTQLLEDAARDGIVITVELEALQPLAMRNYRMAAYIRGAR